MMSKKTMLEKIQKIDSRVIYWVLFITLAIPFIYPLNLPIYVEVSTKDYYNELRTLEEGDIVIISIGHGVGSAAEWLPGMVATMKIIIQQNAKFIVWAGVIDCPVTWDMAVEEVPSLQEYTYGEDYVFMGYFAGAETARAQLATNIRSILTTDHYGTPIEELPLMKDVNEANDIRLVAVMGGADVTAHYIYHWNIPYGTPIISNVIAMGGTMLMPYYSSGILLGMSVSIRGGAELEKLINEPGGGILKMDAINVSHIIIIAFVIIGNLGYYLSTRRRSENVPY